VATAGSAAAACIAWHGNSFNVLHVLDTTIRVETFLFLHPIQALGLIEIWAS
jgi:hypothetical protein